ncbi:MAG: hypothetical protein LBV34_25620 [Nocardiopsaceae bacterium]|jgi:hypothetical protein|nr:hypothetical protein [Nocardiopsaceae bacterium]
MTTYLPATAATPVVRTDFSDQAAWTEVRDGITGAHPDGFDAYVIFVDDAAFAGLTSAELLERLPGGHDYAMLLVVDETTVSSPERPILVVELDPETDGRAARTFRALPGTVQDFEPALRIAAMDWMDCADRVDDDGVLRTHLRYGTADDLS